MECSRTGVGQLPLDDFVKVVAAIYDAHDKHRSIWDVWCHTLHHAASVAELVRVGGTDKKLYTELADFSLWLFTFILKLKAKFGESEGEFEGPQDRFIRIESNCSELLWHKYPKACPLCHGREIAEAGIGTRETGSRICECLKGTSETEDQEARRNRIGILRSYSEEIRAEKPDSIDKWQQMFGMLFAANLMALSLDQVFLHLMEELGEVSDAMIRMYTYSHRNFIDREPNWRQSDLECELADVFSWLFAFVEKLDLLKRAQENRNHSPKPIDLPVEPIRLSRIIWKRYGSDTLKSFCCWKCGNRKCNCEIILVPGTHPAETLIRKFK